MLIDGTVYLDYQAATPVDPRVAEEMAILMTVDFANPSSDDHSLGWRARRSIELSRTTIADAWGAGPDEIIFTSGATEANNIAVLGGALGAPSTRRRLVVSAIEHKAVLEAAYAAERIGFAVEIIPVGADGIVELAALRRSLDETVAVVSVMAVNNETGVVQPIQQVAELAAQVGALSHCDATQAPLAGDVDLITWGVDAASFSSHKLYGPKGVGALYLSSQRPWTPRPLIFGGGQEEGIRPGTLPTPLCVGFAKAVDILRQGGEVERTHVAQLRDDFVAGIQRLGSRFKLTAAHAQRHPGNAHMTLSGVDAADLLIRLQPAVAASLGSACTSGVIGPSHVLSAMGLSDDEAASCIRFSLGRFSDEDQVAQALEAIQAALR
ncbi:cysteine desulfurase family protein [Brevundimonas terrae]|uniref:cysteine desulfurase family protein n=1 Tax=Brevundimonas terrae TaxID=363631 RepID=UPI00141FC0DA|nr:cysteine desulfurase family protein [Brevundimonas terrae]NIJ28019.1 cysteine desulfurase [Brevundimonas terrae]